MMPRRIARQEPLAGGCDVCVPDIGEDGDFGRACAFWSARCAVCSRGARRRLGGGGSSSRRGGGWVKCKRFVRDDADAELVGGSFYAEAEEAAGCVSVPFPFAPDSPPALSRVGLLAAMQSQAADVRALGRGEILVLVFLTRPGLGAVIRAVWDETGWSYYAEVGRR